MWKLKVLVQFILARLPWGEHANYILQHIRGSHHPSRIRSHTLEVITTLSAVARLRKIEGSKVVEIGTGWDAVGALCLYLLGATAIISYDHVRHLRLPMAKRVVEQMYNLLDLIVVLTGIPRWRLEERLARLRSASTETLLTAARIIYRAPSDAARTGLPCGSVDLVYSHAVLEHVPEYTVHELAEEARRILNPEGMAFHYIGFGDHYSGSSNGVSGVNFLKYSPRLWRFFVYNRISYHNRLREKQFIDIFKSHGGSVQVISHTIRPRDLEALKTIKVHKTFTGMTDEQLAVYNGLMAVSFCEATR